MPTAIFVDALDQRERADEQGRRVHRQTTGLCTGVLGVGNGAAGMEKLAAALQMVLV